jgi:hypothetical protein
LGQRICQIDGVGHRITGDRRGQNNRRGRGQGLGWCLQSAANLSLFSRSATLMLAYPFASLVGLA